MMMKHNFATKNKASKKHFKIAPIGAVAALAFAAFTTASHAGTSGTEFQEAYELMTGWVEGFLGRALAIAFLLIGLFMGIARQNLMACGVAIAAAFGLLITPTVLNNILAGTVSAETVETVSAEAVEMALFTAE